MPARTVISEKPPTFAYFEPFLFYQRANAVKREPELQSFWDEERIYERLAEDNQGEKFILHDGPPYANGDLHIGHALNKVTGATAVVAHTEQCRSSTGSSGGAINAGSTPAVMAYFLLKVV